MGGPRRRQGQALQGLRRGDDVTDTVDALLCLLALFVAVIGLSISLFNYWDDL
jgi:hypothetical protein